MLVKTLCCRSLIPQDSDLIAMDWAKEPTFLIKYGQFLWMCIRNDGYRNFKTKLNVILGN